MSKWKDMSTYSRGTPEAERVPHTLELRAGDLEITVHRHIHWPPETWLVSAQITLPDVEPLKPTDLAQAQCQAKAKVQVILEEALRELLAPSPTEGGA